jgi:hypothetical protein
VSSGNIPTDPFKEWWDLARGIVDKVGMLEHGEGASTTAKAFSYMSSRGFRPVLIQVC